MKVVVGLGSCGIAAGAREVYEELENQVNNMGMDIDLEITGCVGMCHLEPIVDIYDDEGRMERFVKVSGDKIAELVEKKLAKEEDDTYRISSVDEEALGKQVRIAIENCGIINPERLEEYIEKDGYKALEKCLKEMSQKSVIDEIRDSGLRGRGGAGFPTWFKWNAAMQEKNTPKFMVCNADEGDPGALWTGPYLKETHTDFWRVWQ